jgi:LysM repeat protein
MEEQRTPNPARLLAPAALVLVTIVFLIIVVSSGGGGGKSSDSQPAANHSGRGSRAGTAPTGPRKRSYTVKTGDTLGAIATKTGVPVDKLLELNPQLDPQALVSGQKIKLRE